MDKNLDQNANIRNFVIIAHIDSGKSTLADRFLEVTHTVEARNMMPQYLDRLPLERERGITIKMAPVRMQWHSDRGLTQTETQTNADTKSQTVADYAQANTDNKSPRESAQGEYIFNLIDTPGHSDFSYEVSRALVAVEGAILLIDATKGIQAQTLSNLRAARRAGLTIIGAVNKVDLQLPHLPKIITAVARLLEIQEEEVFLISAKTGRGVKEILEEVARVVPPPRTIADNARTNADTKSQTVADYTQTNAENNNLWGSASGQRESAMPARALVFDSLYDDHKGIIAFVRVFDGKFKAGDDVRLVASGEKFKIKELGYFSPDFKPSRHVSSGEIGYIATGIKEPALVKIGDTVLSLTNADFTRNDADTKSQTVAGYTQTNAEKENRSPRESASSQRESAARWALPGYRNAAPVVFISLYPDGATKFDDLLKAIGRLQLNDAALSFEPDANEALGRGLKVGFLGQLHFEITASRLESEFNLEFITSFPSIAYRVRDKKGERVIKQPQDFPDDPEKVWQPMIKLEILTPERYVGQVVNLKNVFDLEIGDVINMGENLIVSGRMPLAELIRDFDDQLKSASAGFASFSYELDGEAEAEAEKLEILIAEEVMPELTRIVPRKDLERDARSTVERLKELIPKQQFTQAIQAKSRGRIIARETVPAMKKLLGNFGKTGGDRTRKMKLWKKQQRGKERLEERGRVKLSPEIFRNILKK